MWVHCEHLAHRPLASWQSGGVSRLLDIGEVLRLEGIEAQYRRAISQSVLYGGSPPIQPRAAVSGPGASAVMGAAHEVLTRSDLCPVAPPVERIVQDGVRRLHGGSLPDIGRRGTVDLIRRWCIQRRVPPTMEIMERFDDDQPIGAGLERRLWDRFQREASLAAWVHPQPSFGSLLGTTDDDRRADFLCCPPWTNPLVWEAHGKFDTRDRQKSDHLRSAKWKVFDHLAGKTALKEVEAKIATLLPPSNHALAHGGVEAEHFSAERLCVTPAECYLLDAPWVSSQVDRVLLWLVATGQWGEHAPRIRFEVDDRFVEIVDAATSSWLELIRALQAVWGVDSDASPLRGNLTASTGAHNPADLVVRIDPTGSTYIPRSVVIPTNEFVVRRACFPVDLEGFQTASLEERRTRIRPPAPPPAGSLLVVMQRVFGKPSFRPGQAEAIQHSLLQDDTLIILPTGYGKSMIFQLASLIVPGITLVIEPFRALIDDQVRNLQDHGFGRVLGLHSGRPLHEGALAAGLEAAALIYVAAERMHVEGFIDSVTKLIARKGLDFLVVDEAHTVSQFGHSFRPAYLDLRERVDDMCVRAGCAPATTLGLTATAAQRVIRDVQALLRLPGDPISLESHRRDAFVRENIEDEIHEVAKVQCAVTGNKPDEWIMEYLESVTSRPGQGIVFCPSRQKLHLSPRIPSAQGVDGKAIGWRPIPALFGVQGVKDTLAAVRKGELIGWFFGGESSREDAEAMRAHAAAFAKGERRIMVATSAFGTGIDIQGVRWTLHLGMPAGMEAYYQETGRAGRDGLVARCTLLVDRDSPELLDALSKSVNEDDPMRALQEALQGIRHPGSLARQLKLMIGERSPSEEGVNHQAPLLEPPRRDVKHRLFYLPSFPGWKWEARHVDAVIHRVVLAADPRALIEYECHSYWSDPVWKAIHRLAQLGVIRHGFAHDTAKAGIITFRLERCGDEALEAESLLSRVEAEVLRLTTIERATKWKAVLEPHLMASDPERRVNLSAAMLLKTVYQVVYETRIESLRALERYTREASIDARRQLLEDYFAPSTSRRSLFEMCEKPATIGLLEAALRGEDGRPWRTGVLEVAASEYPGAVLPRVLLAFASVSKSDLGTGARYLYEVLTDESLPADLRRWCYCQLRDHAHRLGQFAPLDAHLAELFDKAGDRVDEHLRILADEDGASALAHVLLAVFVESALRKDT